MSPHPSTYNSPWWYLAAHEPADGRTIGGWYKGGGADVTTQAHDLRMKLRGHTTYLSLAQFGPGQKGVQTRPWEDAFARAGGLLNVVVELKLYGAPAPSIVPVPNGVMSSQLGSSFWSWVQLLEGDLDPLLALLAENLMNCPYFLNVQLCSERDTDHQKGGTVAGKSTYSWQQLDMLSVAGCRYIISYLRDAGVINCTYSAGAGGWDHDSYLRLYVPEADIMQYNAYNHGAWRSPSDVLGRTYPWATSPWYGGGPNTKPIFIAEWGCQPDSGTNKQDDWIRAARDAMPAFPRIAFMSYFDSGWGTLDPSGPKALADCYSGPVFL